MFFFNPSLYQRSGIGVFHLKLFSPCFPGVSEQEAPRLWPVAFPSKNSIKCLDPATGADKHSKHTNNKSADKTNKFYGHDKRNPTKTSNKCFISIQQRARDIKTLFVVELGHCSAFLPLVCHITSNNMDHPNTHRLHSLVSPRLPFKMPLNTAHTKGRFKKQKHIFYPHFVDKRFTQPPLIHIGGFYVNNIIN